MRAASATTLLILCASAAAQSSFRGTHASHDGYMTSISSVNPSKLMMVFAQNTTSSVAGKDTATQRMCNMTKLFEMLEPSIEKDESCMEFAEFFNSSFMDLPAQNQSQSLKAFCTTQCKSFDKTVSEWRQWCTSTEATFEPTLTREDRDRALQATNTSLEVLTSSFLLLGCSKDSHGSYCFDTVTHGTISHDCAWTGTCCWAEWKKVVPDAKGWELRPTCQNSTESCSA